MSVTQQANNTPANIKDKLIFRDVDELDTGMQKVQPLPFLDEEIQKHFQVIKDSIPQAKQVNDAIPDQVFQKVDTVINEATIGKTTLFKASDLLELTSDAYTYARRACLDTFDLERESKDKLTRYDETFKRMIGNRMGAKMDEAGFDLGECRELLVEAVKMADADREKLRDRAEFEEADVSEDVLNEICDSTKDSIRDEKGELEMIRSQCDTDIHAINSELERFHQKMSQDASRLKGEQRSLENELSKNQNRQWELEQELRHLRQEEERLKVEIETGRRDQEGALEATKIADEEVLEWKEKIEELQRRTKTALSVMQHMEECTSLIMNNAKKTKNQWKKRLAEWDLESLLILRDSLVAQGGLYTMISEESKRNSDYATQEVKKIENDKRSAAQTGFAMRVKELGEQVERYRVQMENFQKDIKEMDELMAVVKGRLKEVDAKIKQLRPSIKLDTLEDRYRQRKRVMDKAFEKGSVDSLQFNSFGNYN